MERDKWLSVSLEHARAEVVDVAFELRLLEAALHPLWGQAVASPEYEKVMWVYFQSRLVAVAARLARA
jgi:hypothetical protein